MSSIVKANVDVVGRSVVIHGQRGSHEHGPGVLGELLCRASLLTTTPSLQTLSGYVGTRAA